MPELDHDGPRSEAYTYWGLPAAQTSPMTVLAQTDIQHAETGQVLGYVRRGCPHFHEVLAAPAGTGRPACPYCPDAGEADLAPGRWGAGVGLSRQPLDLAMELPAAAVFVCHGGRLLAWRRNWLVFRCFFYPCILTIPARHTSGNARRGTPDQSRITHSAIRNSLFGSAPEPSPSARCTGVCQTSSARRRVWVMGQNGSALPGVLVLVIASQANLPPRPGAGCADTGRFR